MATIGVQQVQRHARRGLPLAGHEFALGQGQRRIRRRAASHHALRALGRRGARPRRQRQGEPAGAPQIVFLECILLFPGRMPPAARWRRCALARLRGLHPV
ncbi:hypothetical protein WJ973_18015 [Achromobacter xylosoxidans]